MTLAETKPELYRLRQAAVGRASSETALCGKLRLLGEAAAYEKFLALFAGQSRETRILRT